MYANDGDALNGEFRLCIPMGAFKRRNVLGIAVCALFSFSDIPAPYSHVVRRNDSTDPSAKPLMCAQVGADSSASSEDCLSALIYVPSSVKSGSNVPTFMWIHGGSFTEGSATADGLDGIALATATDSIVVVVQYRLGAVSASLQIFS